MLKNKYTTVNIRDYILSDDLKVDGESVLRDLFSAFSCPLNPNVENFLKESAVNFTKKNQSVTYLVFSKNNATLVGYFTLAIKPITVNSTTISKTMQKKLLRVGKIDGDKKELHLSAYLIAQLGKNYENGVNAQITGKQLLEIAVNEVKKLQFRAGGMAVFLEAENHPKLRKFYEEENNFKKFGTRKTDLNEEEHESYVQMLRII